MAEDFLIIIGKIFTIKKYSLPLFFCLKALILIVPIWGADLQQAPEPLQAALFLKLLGFNQNITSGIGVVIYVTGSDKFAEEMKKAVGKAVGPASIKSVESGSGIPAEKPTIIYIGSEADAAELTKYSKSNKILTISGNPDLSTRGITLLVGISEGKPKILLNLTTSKEEGINWNPAILKVASTVK